MDHRDDDLTFIDPLIRDLQHPDAPQKGWTMHGPYDPGFETVSGEWLYGRLREEQRTVLRQNAKGARSAFNVVLNKATALDLEVEVSLRSIDGEIDQGGGLIWRARDGENYYLARFNPMEENCCVGAVVDGVVHQLASAEAVVEPGAWTTLTVRMRGDRIECTLDGDALLEVRDGTFPEAGRIGLWTKADARTEFDDLALRTREP